MAGRAAAGRGGKYGGRERVKERRALGEWGGGHTEVVAVAAGGALALLLGELGAAEGGLAGDGLDVLRGSGGERGRGGDAASTGERGVGGSAGPDFFSVNR